MRTFSFTTVYMAMGLPMGLISPTRYYKLRKLAWCGGIISSNGALSPKVVRFRGPDGIRSYGLRTHCQTSSSSPAFLSPQNRHTPKTFSFNIRKISGSLCSGPLGGCGADARHLCFRRGRLTVWLTYPERILNETPGYRYKA